MNITVLGASGGIGNAVARELVERGHAVRAVNRAGDADVPGSQRLAADVTDPTDAKEACAGAEVVVYAVQPPYDRWERFDAYVDVLLPAVEAAGARLVFADNLYAFEGGDGSPLAESSPRATTSHKGRIRRDLADRLLAANDDGRVRVALGRLSDYYGPRGTNTAVAALGFVPGVRGRTMRGLVDLDQPHTFHYLPDAARGLATLVEDERADGRAWHLPAAPPVTQREMLATINAHLPSPVRVARIGRVALRLGSLFSSQIRETAETTPQWDRPWVVDASALEDTFGPVATTPHDEAVAATVAWFADHEG